jgi:Spy/CpxP family protein refolding chaperone
MSEINNSGFSDEKPVSEGTNLPVKPPKKNSKKVILTVFLVIFIVGGVASFGFAKNTIDKLRGDGPFGFILEKVVKELNLNDQQTTEVNKIKDEIKAKMDANRQKRQDNASEFENMFRSDTFDKSKALDLAKQREANREEMRTFMIDELAKFHSILTPEQRNKAADLMKEKRENRSKFKDRWKDGKRDKRE